MNVSRETKKLVKWDKSKLPAIRPALTWKAASIQLMHHDRDIGERSFDVGAVAMCNSTAIGKKHS
jgi:hypothetical protein